MKTDEEVQQMSAEDFGQYCESLGAQLLDLEPNPKHCPAEWTDSGECEEYFANEVDEGGIFIQLKGKRGLLGPFDNDEDAYEYAYNEYLCWQES